MNVNRNELFMLIMKRAVHRQTLIICAVSAFLCSIAGPFGTYSRVGTFGHFALWFLLIATVTIGIYACFALITSVTGLTYGWQFDSALIILGAFVGGTIIDVELSILPQFAPLDQPAWIWLVIYVGAIMLAVLLVRRSVPAIDTSFEADLAKLQQRAAGVAEGVPDNANAEPSTPVRARLAERLSIPDHAEILRVSADGHHIEVTTCAKTYRTRLRFSDALKELDGLDGIITHRSHWVAQSAAVGWIPCGPKPVVVLRNGNTVPVSRTYRDDVENLNLPELAEHELTA